MADRLLAGESIQDLMLEQIATLKNSEMRKKSDKLLGIAVQIQEIAECLMNRKAYDSERLETARDVWAYQLIMQADHINGATRLSPKPFAKTFGAELSPSAQPNPSQPRNKNNERNSR